MKSWIFINPVQPQPLVQPILISAVPKRPLKKFAVLQISSSYNGFTKRMYSQKVAVALPVVVTVTVAVFKIQLDWMTFPIPVLCYIPLHDYLLTDLIVYRNMIGWRNRKISHFFWRFSHIIYGPQWYFLKRFYAYFR